MAKWIFEKYSRMGGTSARGLRRTLSASGLSTEHRFAREVVQNSVDAAEDVRKPVRIRFHFHALSSVSRAKLIENFGFQSTSIRPPNWATIPDPLWVATIEDFNTVGLTGKDRADQDPGDRQKTQRFIKLCLNYGDASETADGGGTFGFGKTVYFNASQMGAAIFYSRFKDPVDAPNVDRRLLGVALHTSGFASNGLRYTGRGLFGKENGDEVAPMENSDADHWAEGMGLNKRSPAQSGTSIVVVGSTIKTKAAVEAFLDGIFLYWWPRIQRKLLEVEVEFEGARMDLPDVSRFPSLQPFLTCFSALEGQSNESVTLTAISTKKTPIGRLGLTTLAPTDGGNCDDYTNRIVLVRKPLMVVEYHEMDFRVPLAEFAGVFVADEAINHALAQSEPPTHNRWDPKTDDLKSDQVELIKKLMEEIRKAVRSFAGAERAPNNSDDGCLELGRDLAFLLTDKGRSGPGRGDSPISIRWVAGPGLEKHGGDTVVQGQFEMAFVGPGKPDFIDLTVISKTKMSGGMSDGEPCKILDWSPKDPRVHQLSPETWRFPVRTSREPWRVSVVTRPRIHHDETLQIEICTEERGAK